MIFDSHCVGCRRPGPVLCRSCRIALARPTGLPQGDVIAALPFAGRARDVVHALKYANRRQVAHHLAGLLTNRIVAAGVRPADLDVVTWAPTGRRRRHRRGYDQAEIVARRVAAQLGVPCRRLLERDGDRAQTGLDRAHRLHGPTFRVRPGVGGLRVLVIDDVATTGSTLRSAAHALGAAGAANVIRAAVATTPAYTVPATRQPVDTRRRATVDGVRAA